MIRKERKCQVHQILIGYLLVPIALLYVLFDSDSKPDLLLINPSALWIKFNFV